jgi:hypothetical protein
VIGEAGPALLFVPGFVSKLEMQWEHAAIARFLDRLASGDRLVLFDELGTGISDRVSFAPVSMADSVDDVRPPDRRLGRRAPRRRYPRAAARRAAVAPVHARHGVTDADVALSATTAGRPDSQQPRNRSIASMNSANAGSCSWRMWLLLDSFNSSLPATIECSSSASSNDHT